MKINRIRNCDKQFLKKYLLDIQKLFVQEFQDISECLLKVSDPLYKYMEVLEKKKIEIFLTDPRCQDTADCIVTVNEKNEVIGYIFFFKSIFLNKIVVDTIVVKKSYRNQGILKKMLEQLRMITPAISLSCKQKLIPMYEHLGFYIVRPDFTSITMMTKAALLRRNEQVNLLPPQLFFEDPSVIEQKDIICSKVNKSFNDLWDNMIRTMDFENKKISNLFKEGKIKVPTISSDWIINFSQG